MPDITELSSYRSVGRLMSDSGLGKSVGSSLIPASTDGSREEISCKNAS